jgi:uncharacterized protein with HEPN domain
MQRRDKICLEKIIKEIDIGTEMVGETTLEEFLDNEMMKRAVGMTVINVGELIKTVTDELRQQHREVPWKAAAGMRDVTAHRYQTLRMEDVYMTVKKDFVTLRRLLENILQETKREDKDE